MLLLKSLEIRNTCQHENLALKDMRPGLIGILGPSGSGKTNLLQLIKASFTNDFSFGGTAKAAKVYRHRPLDEPSFVTTEWQVGQEVLKLRRGLDPSESRLEFGSTILTRDADIRQELIKILELPPYVLENYVFVNQWEIFDFLRSKPSDRVQNFAHLCGVAHLEQLWSLLGQYIAETRPMTVYDREAEQLERQRLHETRQESEKLVGEIRQWQAECLSEQEVAASTVKINKYNAQQIYKSQLEPLLAEEPVRSRQVADLQRSVATAEAKLKEAAEWLDNNREQYEQSLKVRQRAEKARSCKAVAERIRKELASPPPSQPGRLAKYTPSATITNEIKALKEQLQDSERAIEVFDSGGGIACPVCGTTVEDIADRIAEHRKTIETVPKRIRELQALLQKSIGFERELDDWRTRCDAYRERRARLEGELAGLKTDEVSEEDQTAAEQQIKKYLRRTEQYEDQRQVTVDESHRLDLAKSSLESTRLTIKNLQDKISDQSLSERQVEKLRSKLSQHAEATKQLIRLGALCEANQRRRKEAFKSLKRLKQQRILSKRATKWLQELEVYRSIVHRDNLPTKYMQSAMEGLLKQVNRNLADFGGKFQVMLGSNLAFMVGNRDGTVEPASAKSGGESVVLAIAYRLAVSARFASQIGVMFLDEPTAGLDEYFLDCLAEVLVRVNEVTQKRRQQLFIITHDRRLERVFDQILDLNEYNSKSRNVEAAF